MSVDNDNVGVDPIEYSCPQQNVLNFCKDDLKKQIEALKASNSENVDPRDSLNFQVLSSVKVADFASEVFINKNPSDTLNFSTHRRGTRRSRSPHRRGTRRSKSPHSIGPRRSTSPHSRGTRGSTSPHSRGTRLSKSPHSIGTRWSRSPQRRGRKRSRSPHSIEIRQSRSSHSRGQASPCQEDQRKRKREVKGFISDDIHSVYTINEICEARGRDEFKEEVNDDKEQVLNLVEDKITFEKDLKSLDWIDDCKDDVLESPKEGNGHEYKLFIHNLPKYIVVNKYDVKSIFTKFGVVTGCKRNWKGTKKQIFHVTFKDENVSKKLIRIGQIIVDSHKIKVRKTSEDSKVSAHFVEETIEKRAIMNIFSLFGALKHCKKGINKNESGFFVTFEDERVNQMLIEEGSFDYYGHKILIKEVNSGKQEYKKSAANENIKENVAKPAFDNTYTKSSNVIDREADILENVINITDSESFQEDAGVVLREGREVRVRLLRQKKVDSGEQEHKKSVANENLKENVAKPALDNTYTKSSNVIDGKAVINNADAESRTGAGHEYKLFIYNLTKHIVLTEDKVKSIFTEYGVVTACKRKKNGRNKQVQVYHVTFEDENVSRKVTSIHKLVVNDHKIKVWNTPEVSKISAYFVVGGKFGKRATMNIFSKFGALKHCKWGKNGINSNESGFFVTFEDERVNKMLIEEGSVDYHEHKILIKEVVYKDMPENKHENKEYIEGNVQSKKKTKKKNKKKREGSRKMRSRKSTL